MKFDFLTLLESIVQGFVSFFYSLVRTLFTVAKRPIRGPVRLHAMYRIPRYRQIGGVTFVYLLFFLTFYPVLSYGEFGTTTLWFALKQAFLTFPTMTQENLWPFLGSALISTTIVDGALRLWSRARVRRRGRRDLLLGASEYSLIFAIPPAVLLGWYLLFFIQCDPLASPEVLVPNWPFISAALVPVFCWPAATLLRAGRSASSGGNRAATIALAAAIAALLVLAAYVGVAVHDAITTAADGYSSLCVGP